MLTVGRLAGEDGKMVRLKRTEGSEKDREFLPWVMWRKLFLVSIGTMALAQEEVENMVQTLVEQGELAEKEGRRLVKDLLKRQKKGIQRSQEKGEEYVEEVLDRLQVPTRHDIEALEAQIAELNAKIDALIEAETAGEGE
jgi:poly(hydroxyalkanoate) granule-associated protein